jgi:hypothetical protein
MPASKCYFLYSILRNEYHACGPFVYFVFPGKTLLPASSATSFAAQFQRFTKEIGPPIKITA